MLRFKVWRWNCFPDQETCSKCYTVLKKPTHAKWIFEAWVAAADVEPIIGKGDAMEARFRENEPVNFYGERHLLWANFRAPFPRFDPGSPLGRDVKRTAEEAFAERWNAEVVRVNRETSRAILSVSFPEHAEAIARGELAGFAARVTTDASLWTLPSVILSAEVGESALGELPGLYKELQEMAGTAG